MLGIAALLRSVRIRHALPFVFIGNVGEEGEGDLRGMRHIFSTPRWKDSIAYSLVLDGAGADTIVAEALGSRRFEVIVRGPGGHSWSLASSGKLLSLLDCLLKGRVAEIVWIVDVVHISPRALPHVASQNAVDT